MTMRRWIVNVLIGGSLALGSLAWADGCYEETQRVENPGRTIYCTICCTNVGTPAQQCTRSCR